MKLFRFILIFSGIFFISSYTLVSQNEFSLWTVGSGGSKARFGTNIYRALDSLRESPGHLDKFLLSIAEKPLSVDQVCKRSNLTRQEVEYLITKLRSYNIVKKYKYDKWSTVLPVVTDNQMKIIRKDLSPMAKSVAEFLKKEIPQLKMLYDKCKSPGDPKWEDVSHLVISKLIIDGDFHSYLNELKRESEAGKTDNGKKRVIPAFLLYRGENFSTFGCNWYEFKEGDKRREIFVLHGAVLNRYDFKINTYRRDENFSAGLFKISPGGGIESFTTQEKKILKDLAWISDDRLSVPYVNAGTLKEMLPMIEKTGSDAAKVAFSKFNDLTELYNKSHYIKFLEYKEDYIQVLIHSLFGLTIEQLIKDGALPQIPEVDPESFGIYIVSGNLY